MARPAVIVETHPLFAEHATGAHHPERASRLEAVLAGLDPALRSEMAVAVTPREATREELERVHSTEILDGLEEFCRSGGGHLDADTVAGPESWRAAVVAAGAGVDAAERLRDGGADAAFVVVRPPGHHATPERAMGFCLLNNVAVTAASLAARGERVLIVDFDAHHGNGTQDAFYTDGRVTYVSLHEWPLYPGTGRIDETGRGAGEGHTVNIPLPAGATGDVYLAGIDQVIAPLAERVRPDWLLLSAGFDAHRDDPLTDMGLSAGDYAEITARLAELVPPGRRIAVLEGGYDLDALRASTEACVAALAGEVAHPERVTSGGPGRDVVDAVRAIHSESR